MAKDLEVSSLVFNQNKNIPLPLETAEFQAKDYFDVVQASASDQVRNRLGISKSLFTDNLKKERASKYKEITGKNLDDDLLNGPDGKPSLSMFAAPKPGQESEAYQKAVNDKIFKLRAQDPEKFASLKTNEEIDSEVKLKAKEASDTANKTMGGATGKSQLFGSIVGSIGGDMLDPSNILSMFTGVGEAKIASEALTAAKAVTTPIASARRMGVMGKIALEAGINGGAEISRQPQIMEWQKEVGNEYGWKDAAQNVFMASAFGGGIAAAKELSPLLKKSATARFEAMKAKLKEMNAPRSVLDVVEQTAREAHALEANPFKDTPHLDTGGHMRSLDEVDAAIREGRPIRTENLGVSEAEFRSIDTAVRVGDGELKAARLQDLEDFKSTDYVKAENARKLDELMGRTTQDAPASTFNPKEDFHPEVFPDTHVPEYEAKNILEASDVRAKQELAPDNIATRDAELDTFLSNPKAENFIVDMDGKKIDVATFKKEVTKQKGWLEAIRVCSIGGAKP